MKILYITTIAGSMILFPGIIKELLEKGNTVDIACSETENIPEYYLEWGCKVYPISCSRSPFNKGNIDAVKQIKKIVSDNHYDIVHCHTPIAAACTRLACRKIRKKGTKVFYTAHGFHFHDGAPLKNWLIYYPAEKICSYFTDVLITINKEDFTRAKKKMKAGSIAYVPGVGIDVNRYKNTVIDVAEKRRELGVSEDSTVLLSVGELNDNKNHQTIIRAIAQTGNTHIHYIIAGVGDKENYLKKLASELGLVNRVHLLGFRNDVNELCTASDVFCFPSFREGLGLAAIEAMACGLPIITSNVHGINDYSEDGVTGFKCSPDDVDGFAKAISELAASRELRDSIGEQNVRIAEKYDFSEINSRMMELYYNS